MKKFTLFDVNTNETTDFNSNTAREAALKAATRNETMIVLLEEDKMHIFEGIKRSLTDEEMNEFTRKKNIHSKPAVRKLGYQKLNRKVDLKKKDDITYLKHVFSEYTQIYDS